MIKKGANYDIEMAAIGFAILSVVSAGTLSVLSTKFVGAATTNVEGWKKLNLTEGLEDAVQTGVGKYLDWKATKTKTIPAVATPTPMNFQNKLMNAVGAQHGLVLKYINEKRREERLLD